MRSQQVPGEGRQAAGNDSVCPNRLSSEVCSNAGLQRHEGATLASICPPKGGRSR